MTEAAERIERLLKEVRGIITQGKKEKEGSKIEDYEVKSLLIKALGIASDIVYNLYYSRYSSHYIDCSVDRTTKDYRTRAKKFNQDNLPDALFLIKKFYIDMTEALAKELANEDGRKGIRKKEQKTASRYLACVKAVREIMRN